MINGYERKKDFDQFLKDIIDALYSGSYEDLAGDVHDLDDLLCIPPMFEKYISKDNIEKMMDLVSSSFKFRRGARNLLSVARFATSRRLFD